MTKRINKPELAILNYGFVTFASQILNSLIAGYESCYVTALFSAWVSSQSNYTLRELLHHCRPYGLSGWGGKRGFGRLCPKKKHIMLLAVLVFFRNYADSTF